jgi:hypothetical protein
MIEMGKVGFVWWFGIVEDVMDPLQLGRVKVRVHHFYSPSETKLPTEALPWAHVVMPVTSASYQGKGWSPTFIRPSTTVFGFFVDGGEAQMPIVLGTYPGIPQPNPDFVDTNNLTVDQHDVSQLARGINKLAATKSSLQDSFEPSSRYNAQYPYNKVFESERGHVVEMDDTPGAERIHLYHNQGSYVEISTGLRVDKTNGTSIDVSSVGKYIRSAGDTTIFTDGMTTIYSEGAVNIISKNSPINISAPIINMSGSQAINIQAPLIQIASTVSTSISTIGLMSIASTGATLIKSGATMTVSAVGLNTITGSILNLRGLTGLNIVGGGPLSVTAQGIASFSATGALTLAGSILNLNNV